MFIDFSSDVSEIEDVLSRELESHQLGPRYEGQLMSDGGA